MGTSSSPCEVGLVGGSFNPPHVAHQMVALWLLATGRTEQVWLLPCFVHPFAKPLVDFEHRCQMCALALREFREGSVQVSRVEADIGGTSRTLNTLRFLMTRYPDHRFKLVIGADILEDRHSWYGFDEIERLVEIVVMGRQGYDVPPGSITLPPVSSSAIRERLRAGQSVDALLPRAVLDYIQTHDLYR